MKKLTFNTSQISIILILFICAFRVDAQIAPSSNYPWVKVQTAKVPTTNPADLDNPEKGRTIIQYLDGYGESLQTVHHGASPTGKDIITGVETLDALRRSEKSYLPVNAPHATGQYFNNVETATQAFYNDSKPYSKVAQYDASPANRVLKVFSPGEVFQTATSQGVQQDYSIAGAGIRRYIITDDNTINGTSTYTDGKLIRTYSKDEDGNESIEYRGAQSGKLIQVHRKDRNSSKVLITAYVYDFMNRLRFIITPKLYNTTTDISVSSHAEGLYIFRYDERSRLVETNKPGAGAEYTIYNELGQVVMAQNARHRESNTWLWIKYDGHGRVVMNGTLNTGYTRNQIQGFFDNYTESEQFEEPSTSAGNLLRYTNRSFPSAISINETMVKMSNYYDTYNWVNDSSLDFELYQNSRWTNATGLPTGTMVRRLDNGIWMKTVWYYDDQNRLIQTKSRNRYGTVNRTDNVLTFEGDLLEEKTIYRKPGHEDLTISKNFIYDKSGIQIAAIHKINGVETPLAKYEHDEVGRMVRKYLGVADGIDYIVESSSQPSGDRDIAFKSITLLPGTYTSTGGTYLAAISPGPLQTIDYSYTIRNQLRGINLDATGNTFDLKGSDVFAVKFDHHETGQTFNGKLHKQTWKTKGQPERSFIYGYDGFDRINSALYAGSGGEDYGMPGIDYDDNGNLAAFNRKGLQSPGNWQSIDVLSFNYQSSISNKLSYIVDYGDANVGFKDNGGFGSDYTYWEDGSLKSDANKGITLIEYNYLDQVEKVHFGVNKRIEYSYDGEGTKLEQRLINDGAIHTTEYLGDLVYVNNVLQTILHDEGKVKVEASNYRYQFFINDALGNTRIIIERVNDTTALLQETHYGVWGEKLEGIGQDGDWKFLFQGKEYIDFEGLNLYDFHTRTYDPWAGRFWQIDGADQFVSGYVGMGNMPTIGIDPDGQFFFIIPQIGWSKKGGLNLGIEFGVGIPWLLSASVTGGYNFGSKKGYASVQGSVYGLYAGYGTQGGFVGWGYTYAGINMGINYSNSGLGAGIGFGGSSGNFSGGIGIGWNQSSGFDYNIGGGAFGKYEGLNAQGGDDPIYFGGTLSEVKIYGRSQSTQAFIDQATRTFWLGALATANKPPAPQGQSRTFDGITPNYFFASLLIPIPKVGLFAKGTAGTNAVYQGLDAAGNIKYVGITAREPSIRFAEHLGSIGTGKELLRYRVVKGAEGLTRTQARVWEQRLINQYGMSKNGGALLNQRNSISPKYWAKFGIK